MILYRLYDAADTLLYVGITNSTEVRFGAHAKTQPWWKDVIRTTTHRYPDRRSVLAAEQLAIQCEMPRYNRCHNGPFTIPRDRHGDPVNKVGDWMAVLPTGRKPHVVPAGLVVAGSHREMQMQLIDWETTGELSDEIITIKGFSCSRTAGSQLTPSQRRATLWDFVFTYLKPNLAKRCTPRNWSWDAPKYEATDDLPVSISSYGNPPWRAGSLRVAKGQSVRQL
jgi:hypothetical protein